MSLIKKLDSISGTEERSKTLSEAINKVEKAMNDLKGNKKPEPKSKKAKDEVEEA